MSTGRGRGAGGGARRGGGGGAAGRADEPEQHQRRGDWKDYALDFTPQKSVFSIYRRASEVPLYRVEKDPSLARKQGAYAVISATGFVLKRGHELVRVLRVLERKPKLSVV